MNCRFCLKEKIDEFKLFETSNFVVKVGYAIVAPGHVLIVSKKHIPCFSELPEKLYDEFFKLKKTVIENVTQNFSEPFLIEYGPFWQSVPHAHLHVIPKKSTNYEIKSVLKEMLIPSGVEFKEAEFKELKGVFKKLGTYAAFEDKGRLFVCFVKKEDALKPNLFIKYRAFFTVQKSLDGISSWKNMSDNDKERDKVKRELTINRLKF